MERERISVLYAEDDVLSAMLCKDFLEFQGYRVFYVRDGEMAWRLYRKINPDVVLLDIMMPKKNGYEVARLIRAENQNVPILFISALASSVDVVTGLDLGADDYIRKEFLLEEVDARIRAALRRQQHRTKSRQVFRIGEHCLFSYVEQHVIIADEKIHLTPMEAKILYVLCEHMNEVVLKEDMIKELWKNDFSGNTRYLDKYMMSVRKILEKDPSVRITTISRKGYCLVW
ncbi:response regulator transcription factor [uncultured Sanguibacteroides sp.]|uniref:response regulator transcription factor n=1 Tax=uncultured Sanguibacteroides sp. TaxID=1635151 RepID=UPI0025FCDB06|nr:response regulator transcription factor [uncultured Sanguibacteroides sp.]